MRDFVLVIKANNIAAVVETNAYIYVISNKHLEIADLVLRCIVLV